MNPINPRQQHIIDAALPFISLNPTATIQEIAAAAGISKATFHRHFDSRDRLFAAMADHALQALRTALAALPQEHAAEQRLRTIIHALTAQGDKVYFLFYYPNNKAPKAFDRLIQATLAPYYATLATLDAQGYFDPRLPLAWVTNGLHTHIAIAWVQVYLGNVTLNEAVERVWILFFDGAKRPNPIE